MRKANPYRQTKLKTATPLQRVILCYDGILKDLNGAIALLAEPSPSQIEAINNKFIHANKIVVELKMALDLEQGGEVAENLDRLYEYWITRISEANVHKDAEIAREIAGLVSDIRESWVQAQTAIIS